MVITWDFDPIAFTIPFINLSVRWYGLMFAGENSIKSVAVNILFD